MLNFSTVSLANHSTHDINSASISQDSKLHIVNWPHDILRLVGRLMPRKDAISFTSTCVLLFTLRYKAGGHGILYAQRWKRIPNSPGAIRSALNLENRTTVDWHTIKNYAPAISAVTLDFNTFSSQRELASLVANLKDLVRLTTLNIHCPGLNKAHIIALLLTVFELNNLQSLTIFTDKLTTLPTGLEKLKRLQSLLINVFYLTRLPAELGQLQHLQSLTINAKKLTTLPAELAQLQSLQNLTVKSYSLTTLPAELGQLTNLQNLFIEAPELATLPSELGQLQMLQILKVTTPCLKTLPAELGQLQNLQSLTIDSHSLTTLPAELGQLQSLQSLTLWTSRLTTLPSELGLLQNLKSIHIFAKNLTNLPPEFGQLQSLQILTIYKGCIFPAEMNYLKERGVIKIIIPPEDY